MKEIEIYKKMLNSSEVNFEEGLVKNKKGLSLKPYFQRNIISEEEIKNIWFSSDYLTYEDTGDYLTISFIRDGCLIVLEKYCSDDPTVKEIKPLNMANVEGLSFPIVKTSYKRVVKDLLKRGFIQFENKFISANMVLKYKSPRLEYGFKYPVTIKGEIAPCEGGLI